MLLEASGAAQAAPPAFVNVCTGLGATLPVLQPVAGITDTLLTGLLAPVAGDLNTLVGGVNTNLQQALSGKTIGIGVLDPATNSVVALPSGQCNLTSSGVQVNNNTGITLGGGQVLGLGGTANPLASAGDSSAIALGNGATTNAGVANAVALGTNALVSAPNSVAMGAGSAALRGALGPTTAFGLAAPQTSVGEVSLGAAGATRQLTNLAAGTADTDGINLGQLRGAVGDLGTSLATNIGAGSTYNASTGTVTNPNITIQGTTYTTIGGALNALASGIGGVGNQKYFQANSTLAGAQATASDAVAIGPVAVAGGPSAVAVGNGARATGANSVALGAGSTDAGQANVVSVGSVGGERRIVNVAAGAVSATSTDAVNGSQLYAVGQQVATIDRSSLRYDTDSSGNTLSSVSLHSDQGGPVVIHNLAAGVADTDAATVGQVRTSAANSVQYTTVNGARSNTIALQGGGPGGVLISNVAAGVSAGDAVNLGQLQGYGAGILNQANIYTNQQISNLAALTDREIAQVRSDANGGTALALAATGLRYDDRPGKISVSGATAYFHDQVGLAFGLGGTSDNGRVRFNAAITASPTMRDPDVGAVVGASYSLN